MQKFIARQLYDVMYHLVDQRYFETYSDDIGGLAGEMGIGDDDNSTLDPAIWYEWMEAIDGKKAKVVELKSVTNKYGTVTFYDAVDGKRERELPNKKLTLRQGYNAAIRFLTKYADRLESKDIKAFIDQLTFEKWVEAASKIEQSK